jgi:hypothetical protein
MAGRFRAPQIFFVDVLIGLLDHFSAPLKPKNAELPVLSGD